MSKTREWKKERELEEARKAGTAAPAKDAEGNDINPHIPHYMIQRPFYLKTGSEDDSLPTLKHQRNTTMKYIPLAKQGKIVKGIKLGTAKTYRKGACANCGSGTHSERDCTERPRKKGAKWTGKNIAADELEVTADLDYDGKHDRWNNYDPEQFVRQTVPKFKRQEEERNRIRDEELQQRLQNPSENDHNSDEDDGGELTVVDSSKDPRSRTRKTIRVRDDQAKYLINLDPEGPYFDGKSRSMRGNPNPNVPAAPGVYTGDNATRVTGDAIKFNEQEVYAEEANNNGLNNIHTVAAPTQTAMMHKEFLAKKEEVKNMRTQMILMKYGDKGQMNAPSTDTASMKVMHAKQLQYGASEQYKEYSRDGRLLLGHDELDDVVATSKYDEDVLNGNHTEVWGSFWSEGQWGYACCRQMIFHAYCTGKDGIEAREEFGVKRKRQMAEAEEEERREGNVKRQKVDVEAF